ncbi:MAG: type I-B CRISPR-associated protein Cas5b [Intestinibacter bartlettii]|uniref:type I-B CRISPR-associated protein Cas5b n=1 Tax=Intestinibacter bartlettii TaxID=261299 RepID=UPI0026EE559E|nr:type I-B CRISPR-associated protein Cas5b [Intestinibacter bartlettii]MDO5010882.1 type I-B CRISPR-associated protein Cas5b [Intestinibacter bartlettii]
MKILKFRLYGRNAFFKKPDVNAILYYTYGNIHKVALLGMFGAILGYGGYNNMDFYNQKSKKQMDYPEFYSKLKDLKVSIVPKNEGFFEKKVQIFNNTVGYASKEQGGNLITREQWLEYPSWDIYFQICDEISENLADSIINRQAVYIPYLGKNDHIANIDNVELFEDKDIEILKNTKNIDCMFKENMFRFNNYEEDEENEEEDDDDFYEKIDPFKYQERLPVALEQSTNLYVMEKFIFTNMNVSVNCDIDIFEVGGRKIVFY